MLNVSEALARILAACRVTNTVSLPLDEALGLHLASDVTATYGVPEFDNSAMDGYAVRAIDLVDASDGHPVSLPLHGVSKAGATPTSLEPKTTMRIYTGAPLPQGADAVVMQENVHANGNLVTFSAAPRASAYVRAAASDIAPHSTVLTKGQRIGPGEIGLLASLNIARVDVLRRPRVAILSTGDELRELGSPRTPFTIVNSNAHALAALVRESDAEPWILDRVRDDPDAIAASIQEGLAADLLLSTGGVSVGDYDFVQEAFARSGVSLDFWRVAMKPGKPLMFGRSNTRGTPVIGLPGNPASAMVTFELFAHPAIQTMLGSTRPYRAEILVELTHDIEHATGRTEYVRVSLAASSPPRPTLRATAQRSQGSHSLVSMVNTDALLVLPADVSTFRAGEHVTAILRKSPNSAVFEG